MMTSNDTPSGGSVTAFRRGSDATAGQVVLVADGDQAVTDEIADALRDGYVVRTAAGGEELLATLDDDLSVALLDPTLPATGGALDRLVADADCRVAAVVTDSHDAVDERFDGCVRKPVSRSALRATVDRLCRCVSYRDALDRYFDLARTLAGLDEDDPQRDRLAERLDALEAELDETAAPLDSNDVYDAALREQ
jgi:CheY-like chemotaxis protein